MFIIKHNAKIYIYTSRCLSATVYTSWDILTCQDLPLPSGSTALGYDFTAQVKSVPGLSLLYTRTCIPHYCFSRIAIRYFTFKHKHLEIHFIGCLDAVRSTCGFIRISADKSSWETVSACTMRVLRLDKLRRYSSPQPPVTDSHTRRPTPHLPCWYSYTVR